MNRSGNQELRVSLPAAEAEEHLNRIARLNVSGNVSESVADRVKAIVSERLNVEPEKITNLTSFVNDLGADSLDIVEIVMEFEEEFQMTIPDDKAEQITTVGQAISYIEENRGES
jgi:acyl carrier protein